MKKTLRILTVAAVAVLLTACNEFFADPEEFFSYWAAEVVGTASAIDKPIKTIGGVPCVPSASDVTVTITLKNPKNVRLITSASSTGAQDVIRFPGLSSQPVYGTYYTLVQTANDKLQLTYKPLFLKDYEWSTKDIGAEITFVSTAGRPFSKKCNLNLKVNTPPPKPTAVLAQTNSPSPTYVLCLEVPDMGVSVTGGLLHKDIAEIEINGTPYPLTVSGGGFVKPADAHFITAVTRLAGYPAPPTGAWVLYYDTGLAVGNAYRAYTVKLKDNKGLVSAVLETGTARPQLSAETVNITKGTQGAGSGLGGTTGSPIIINGETSAPEAQITIQNIAGTTVHCTVQEVVGGSATGAVSQYDTNPVTASLGLGTANEKMYEVKYHTDGTGYTASAVTTKYYKVLKCHSVTFDANGGTFTDGSTTSTSRTVLVPHNTAAAAPSGTDVPDKTGYHVDGWYTEAACTTQWNFSTQTITGDKQLYAKWAPNSGTSYRVEHYKEDLTENQYTSPQETENPTGTTGANITGIYKTYTGFQVDRQDPPSATIAPDGTTVVKVYYKRKTVNVTFNPNGGTISGSTSNVTLSGRFGTSLTVPANPVKTGYTFSGWSPLLSTPPVFPSSNTTYMAQWTTNTYKVRFNGNGNTGGGMSEQSFTYGQSQYLTANGFTKTGHTFDGWATSAGGSKVYSNQQSVSNLTNVQNGTVNLYAVWKINTYTVRFNVADGEGRLQGTYGSQNPTTQNGSGEARLTNVPHGTSVTFTAAPDNGWELDGWTGLSSSSLTATLTVDSDKTVTVKFKPGEFNLAGGPDAWKRLKEEAAKTKGSHTIVINGEITATSVGEIKLGRNLTIRGGSSAVLNASGITRIFKVENGKTLILKDITLKNAQVGSTKGGGVYIDNGGTLIMQGSSTITNCKAGKGGGVYVAGTFKMEGSALVTAETGRDNEVYLESGKTVTVTGALTNTPAAKIRVADYQKNRVLAVGEHAKKKNFKLAPDGGNNWRYKEVGNEVKFVTGKLTYTIEKIISVEEHDGTTDAEYYWTMELDGQNVHSLGSDNSWKPKKKGKTYNINSSKEVLFNYTDKKTVGAYFLIKEEDHSSSDDLIAEVTKDITYQNDQLEFEGQTISLYQEKTFRLEFHNTSEGEVDVVCRIRWEYEL